MMSFILYRRIAGVPRRALSVSSKLSGGHGTYHEGDESAPKEFLEAAAFLSEVQRPSSILVMEQDLTPEFLAQQAKKYNMLPEDYYPACIHYGGAAWGDYPKVVEESYFNRDATYEWDILTHRRNFGQVIGVNEQTVYGQCNRIYDGQMHVYGFWQYWQHLRLYVLLVLISIIPIGLSTFVDQQILGLTHSFQLKKQTDIASGRLLYQQWWSHQALEFKDIFLKMQQAKQGFPGRSSCDQWPRSYDTSSLLMGAGGNCAGRDRHGPTGASFVRTEHQDTYMPPAGSLAFKFGHFTNPDNQYFVHPADVADEASKHLSHGHDTLASIPATECIE